MGQSSSLVFTKADCQPTEDLVHASELTTVVSFQITTNYLSKIVYMFMQGRN